jgi:pSer/pThr/pTyr-binding forkhead associated (FHA) protein
VEIRQAIIAQFVPKAVLKASTREAELAVPQGLVVAGMVGIRGFPFRVGRESRGKVVEGVFHRVERPRRGDSMPTNDLYLADTNEILQISREHFSIERTAKGYQVVDRRSVCGTAAGGVRIGGHETGGTSALRDGDEILVGTDVTPYRYTFIVCSED